MEFSGEIENVFDPVSLVNPVVPVSALYLQREG